MRKASVHVFAISCVAPASTALVILCSGSALAQGREQALIDELVRKSEAGQLEGSLCAGTGWPPGDSLEGFTAFLNAAKAGSWKVNTFANGNCELNRVTRVHVENGGKCVTYKLWACTKGASCGTGANMDCLDSSGKFVNRKTGVKTSN
jgi:hypothetical protein